MTPEQKRTFLQCLFTAAWTDGSLQASEHAILATLYNNVDLPPADREVVDRWFDEPPPEPDWLTASSSPELRKALVSQVVLVAASDGAVDIDEMGLLERLRTRLGMDDAEFQKVVLEVEKVLAP